MIKQPKRPTLGSVINSAAGALQQHVLLQQMKAAQLRKDALPQHTQPETEQADEQYAGIVFSGNPHETVPRQLLLDDRLSPLERNAWQVFRLLIHSDGVTAFPTYDQLRPYLGSTPGKPASRETIAKTLTLLRLTRWLSLGRRVRDAESGRVQGNVYILHDEPIGCAEAMEIDRDYMLLIGQSLEHANKSVRLLAERAFTEVTSDPHVRGASLPSRLEVLEQRLQQQESKAPQAEFGIRTLSENTVPTLSSDSELSKISHTEHSKMPSSESELRLKLADLGRVRNPNSYSTYTNTNTSVSKSFVLYPEQNLGLELPETLLRLTQVQREQAMVAIAGIQPEIRQSVLNQWHHRVQSGSVKNPLAYLLSCVQRAVKGEFNAQWQAPTHTLQHHIATALTAHTTRQPEHNPATTPNLSSSEQTHHSPLKRDENTVARGKERMRNIREELGYQKRPGADSP